MTKIAYFECPTGIAGDMCLGALVDLGVPLDYLTKQLENLRISEEYRLKAEKIHKNGQIATKVHVILLVEAEHHHKDDRHQHHHHHDRVRHLPEIETIIVNAKLPTKATEWSLAIFRQLAVAEGAVHGIPPEKVHFHEVGATDAIVDIVGTCLGLNWLGIEKFYCSPMPTGGGMVKAAHGRLSVPVPAVLKLWSLRQVPVYSNGIDRELVTPTGAAIATTLATSFGAPPAIVLEKIGLGAGTLDLAMPNLLRLWVGDAVEKTVLPHHEMVGSDAEKTFFTDGEIISQIGNVETVAVLETQIDDIDSQVIAYTLEELLTNGALDVFTQAIVMKKSRSGILLTAICPPDKMAICQEIIFRETTTLGIRQRLQSRSILEREIQQVETVYGRVGIKVAKLGVKVVKVQPEYEDCAKLARENQQSLQFIRQMALDVWYRQKT
jgi:pyridinium-3,5-bisthiocarboxylic acid mononucleotide nickel chelatase